MQSKVLIDINQHRQEHVFIRFIPTEDPRDKLVGLFLQTACPAGLPANNILDGFCRISLLEQHPDGGLSAEIIPIHPLEMPNYISMIKENADKFKTPKKSILPKK